MKENPIIFVGNIAKFSGQSYNTLYKAAFVQVKPQEGEISLARKQEKAPEVVLRKKKKFEIAPYGMLLPTIAFFIVFVFWPFARSIYLSFTLTNNTGDPVKWVGLMNYQRVFSQSIFWKIFENTFVFAAIVGVGTFAIAMALAALCVKERPGGRVYQTMFSITMAIASAPAAAIGMFIFKESGLLNQILGTSIPWLTSSDTAMYAVAALTIWLRIGSSFIFLMVGFRAVSQDLVEAATIDGANAWNRFWKVIVPMSSPQIFFVVFLNITGSFKAFGQIKLLTGGGPSSSSETLIYSIYKYGLLNNRFETACVYSLVLFLVIFLVTRIQFLLEKRLVHYQ